MNGTTETEGPRSAQADIQISIVLGATDILTRHFSAVGMLKMVRQGSNKDIRKQVEFIRKMFRSELAKQGDYKLAKKAIDPIKKQLPAVTWSGTFTERHGDKLITHSGLLCADLDHLDSQLNEVREKLLRSPNVWAVFVSPSGDGLKVVFRVPADASKHRGSFRAIEQYVKNLTGVQIDESGKDVARLCFLSYDPQLFHNPQAVEIEPLPEPERPRSVNGATADLSGRQRIVNEILVQVDWESETAGFTTCPGKHLHTTGDGERDCKVDLDQVPTVHCFHNSCRGILDGINHEIRSRIAKLEYRGEQITGKANEHTDSSVNVNQPVGEEPPESASDTKRVPFPEEAWQGPFKIWRDIVCPATEAPEEYLWASCLITIGLVLGRSVVLRNPRSLFPNFFALLLGQTGDDRKSTALDFSLEAIFHVGLKDSVHVLHGIQSSEAIFDSLGRCEGAKTLAHIDELRSLLGVTRRTGAGEIIPRLGSLYYCPYQDSLDRHGEESTIITKPFLSLISATPLEYVHDLLGEREVNGGFLNRFLTVTGKPRGWKAIACPPEDDEWQPFVTSIQYIASRYSDHRFSWTPESTQLWTEFYIAWKNARQDWDTREQQLTARIDEHILKLAMVYSAIAQKSVITPEALITAISIGKWLQAIALDAFSEVGHTAFSKAETVVLGIVKKHKKIYRRYLQQWVYKKAIDGDLLTKVINVLVKNGQVFEGKEKTSSGRERPWVEYLPPVNG